MLDLNAFERQKKAESLGMVTEEGSSKSMSFGQLDYKIFEVPNRTAHAYLVSCQGNYIQYLSLFI